MAEPTYELYRPTDSPVPERQVRRAPSGGCCGGPGLSQQWLTISAVCVGIWLVTGAGYFWPIWVVLGLGVPRLLGRR